MRIKIPNITAHIRKILMKYPHSKPKQIAFLLWNKVGKDYYPNRKGLYRYYRDLIKTEKCIWNKWLKTEEKTYILGRPLKPLNFKPLPGSHRVEYSLERPLSQFFIEKIKEEANKNRPKIRDKKPFGVWYVIPNRNRMMELHNKFITIRVFPKSGTIRILPGLAMPLGHLKVHVENALYFGGLSLEEISEVSKQLIPVSRHRIFNVGKIDPFKIKFYKDSLGLIISADGSHPRHLETEESYPSWIKDLFDNNLEISKALKEFSEQIEVHLSVLRGIKGSTEELNKAILLLTNILHKLEK